MRKSVMLALVLKNLKKNIHRQVGNQKYVLLTTPTNALSVKQKKFLNLCFIITDFSLLGLLHENSAAAFSYVNDSPLSANYQLTVVNIGAHYTKMSLF